uniref:Uncharacterized protein n=1 Tax=Opuntia streptacantha TaxID=393608 RepID=A0A7C9A968_OPUST
MSNNSTFLLPRLLMYVFRKPTYEFSSLIIDCFSSLSRLLTSGGFLASSSLISRSNSLINLLHSLIFPVSSSSCLLCLLGSLILSSFWKPLARARKLSRISPWICSIWGFIGKSVAIFAGTQNSRPTKLPNKKSRNPNCNAASALPTQECV